MVEQIGDRQKELADVETKIEKLEEKMMNDEIKASTYKKWFNKYAGEKDTLTAAHAMCALRDGLDAADSIRFPSHTYGAVSRNNAKRYINIQKKYSSKGALLDDVAHAMMSDNQTSAATGINDVWKQASQHRGRLLIIEKNFSCAGEQGCQEDLINMPVDSYSRFSYVKDAVDDVIEKVLEDGGDVEFVEDGLLKDYRHISLIQHY